MREEVRITKTPHVEQRVASENLRREEVDVQRDDERRRGGILGRDDDDDKRNT